MSEVQSARQHRPARHLRASGRWTDASPAIDDWLGRRVVISNLLQLSEQVSERQPSRLWLGASRPAQVRSLNAVAERRSWSTNNVVNVT